MIYQKELPEIDVDLEIDFLVDFIRDQVRNKYRREGIIVGISGGIDSAVTAVLSLKAVGRDNLITMIMPEKESSPLSEKLARELAEKFGMKTQSSDLTPILENFGVYNQRNSIVQKYFPEFDGSQKWKLVQPGSLIENESFNFYSIKIDTTEGAKTKRINIKDLRAIIGATDVKQRTRMCMLYQAAESNNYLVAGTTNLSETMLGFFVQYGDGGVDIEPLSYLLKTYIFKIAERLDIPKSILDRPPSPDTFSLEVSDDEFFFRLPYKTLDLFLWAMRDNIPPETISDVLGIDQHKVHRILQDIRHKYEISEHLRQMPAQPERKLP